MCGIAGLVGGKENPGSEPVERMLATLVHRGPDSGGCRTGDGWAIGARRLAIVDLVTGDQPVSDESGEVWAVLNGEIYNYRELREELLALGHRLRSTGDTEVLVHLWQHWGPAMLRRLRGMFAFALLDDRQKVLFLARDRLGKKPLYWTRQAGRLLFASELKALRAVLPQKPALDPRALASFLAFGFVPEGQCILHGVEKLPPAQWLSLDVLTGEVRQGRYWQLEPAPDEGMAFGEAARELTELLGEAVRLRLRSDVPLAIFLSGGLDSGLVGALAAREAGRPRAITASFDAGNDELLLARATASHIGLELTELEIDARAGLDLLPRLAEVVDEPLADSSAIPTLLLAREARSFATVVLNGDGGDEALAGYRRFLAARLLALPGARWWGRPLGKLGLIRGRALRVVEGLRSPERSYLAWGPVKFTPAEIAGLLVDAAEPAFALEPLLERFATLDDVNRLRMLELHFFLPGDLLVKMDRATMAASLEARSPFLDHVLLERVAAFPPGVLLRGWRTKAVAREAAFDLLPTVVRWARKRGFEVPLQEWLAGPWAGEVRAVLEDPSAALRALLPSERLQGWLHWQRMRDPARAARAVYTLLTLEHWLRRWA